MCFNRKLGNIFAVQDIYSFLQCMQYIISFIYFNAFDFNPLKFLPNDTILTVPKSMI